MQFSGTLIADVQTHLPAWEPVLRGTLLGLSAAAPIGPVNVEIARRVLRNGFLAGAALGGGAVTVDILYAILSTLSFVRLAENPAVVLAVTALGAVLLGYLGWQCLRAAAEAWRVDPLAATVGAEPPAPLPRRSLAGAYVTGLLMTLLNPMTLAFWFVVLPATGAGATSQAAGGYLPMMCLGVFIGTSAWVLSFATLMSLAGRAAGRRPERRRRWLAVIDALGGVALLSFAVLAVLGFLRRLGPFL